MRLNFYSLLLIVVIKIITTTNLKSEKQCILPVGINYVNGQKILVNYLSRANSNAFAINNGIGNANSLANSYAGNSNNILYKARGFNGIGCDN
jgi:hypothetical protein